LGIPYIKPDSVILITHSPYQPSGHCYSSTTCHRGYLSLSIERHIFLP
jgi:hypothetical protein